MGITDTDPDLFDAAEFGDLEWVQQSIGSVGLGGKPIDINAQDLRGETILMIAARYGWVEIVRFLLKKGADPDCKDDQGQTALMKAEARGLVAIVDLLKGAGLEA